MDTHKYGGLCMHMCVGARRQGWGRTSNGGWPSGTLCLCFEAGSLAGLELYQVGQTNWLATSRGPPVSGSHHRWDYRYSLPHQLFTWVLGTEVRNSCLQGTCFTYQTTLLTTYDDNFKVVIISISKSLPLVNFLLFRYFHIQ